MKININKDFDILLINFNIFKKILIKILINKFKK